MAHKIENNLFTLKFKFRPRQGSVSTSSESVICPKSRQFMPDGCRALSREAGEVPGVVASVTAVSYPMHRLPGGFSHTNGTAQDPGQLCGSPYNTSVQPALLLNLKARAPTSWPVVGLQPVWSACPCLGSQGRSPAVQSPVVLCRAYRSGSDFRETAASLFS